MVIHIVNTMLLLRDDRYINFLGEILIIHCKMKNASYTVIGRI